MSNPLDYRTPRENDARQKKVRRVLIAAVLVAVLIGLVLACAGFLRFAWSMR